MINEKWLSEARKQITDPRKLVIAASRRAKQISRGGRPMIKTQEPSQLNIALEEIGEGLLTFEREKK
jgi:DNA-directed RNA polymerase omega subunit